MDFFKIDELLLLNKWAGAYYEKAKAEHREVGTILRDTVWSKTIYWAAQVAKVLGNEWQYEGTKTWSQRGWGQVDNKKKRGAIIKGYTWARIFKKKDNGKDIFFTVGYDSNSYFQIKFDFQRERDSTLSAYQKNVCQN